MREVEIKGIFEVQGEEYSLFVENATRLTKVYLLKKKKESQCMEPILVKISAGTLKEKLTYRLMRLKMKLVKNRSEKS